MEKTLKKPSENRGMANRKRRDMAFYASLVALPLIQFIIMYIVVNFNSVLLSFQFYNGETSNYEFLPLNDFFRNFARIFDDIGRGTENSMYLAMAKNSLYGFLATLVGVGLSMIFSYYVFKKMLGHNFFKIILFVPSIIPAMVSVIIFNYFANSAVKDVVVKIFHGSMEYGLLSNPDTKLGTILFYNVWIGFGTQLLMYVGAMNNISDSMLEAAQIDGASALREFVSIIFPCVYSTFSVFVTVAFAQIFVNQLSLFSFFGTSASELSTIGYYIYKQVQGISKDGEFNSVAALGILCTIIILPITLGVRYLLRKIGPSVD